MYAVIGHFSFQDAPDAPLRERIAAEILDPLSAAPGFLSLRFVRVTETASVVVHCWSSQADAEEGLRLIAPRIQQLRAEGLVGAVERSVGEVVAQR